MTDDNAVSTIKRFGRAWLVEITTQSNTADGMQNTTIYSISSTAWTPEPLHIVFDTVQTMTQGYWLCDVTIYNLNDPTTQDMIKYGMVLRLYAGYQSDVVNGKPGMIFEGTIFQPTWEREDGTDTKLTLHCICGLLESSNNFVAATVGANLTQRQIVAQMAASCTYPLQLDIDEFSSEPVTQSTTYFGQPNDFLQAVADANSAMLWFSHMTAHIRQLYVDQTVPELQYGPDSGLIGTPQQGDNSVSIRVLLDSRAILRGQFKLTPSTVIRQQVRTVGSYPSILSQTGEYIVGRIHHYGDSRGNDWYTELTGFLQLGSVLSLSTAIG